MRLIVVCQRVKLLKCCKCLFFKKCQQNNKCYENTKKNCKNKNLDGATEETLQHKYVLPQKLLHGLCDMNVMNGSMSKNRKASFIGSLHKRKDRKNQCKNYRGGGSEFVKFAWDIVQQNSDYKYVRSDNQQNWGTADSFMPSRKFSLFSNR